MNKGILIWFDHPELSLKMLLNPTVMTEKLSMSMCVWQDEEVAMLLELSHLQEVLDQLEKHTADPFTLPAASEQVTTHVMSSK